MNLIEFKAIINEAILKRKWLVIIFILSAFFIQIDALNSKVRGCGSKAGLQNMTRIKTYSRRHSEAMKAAGRTKQPPISKNLGPSNQALEPKPIRFHVDYQIDYLEDSKKEFLKYELIPMTLATIQSFVKVKRPVVGKLALPRTCITYYPQYPDYCTDLQPDNALSDQYWSYCGEALHKQEFFNDFYTCTANVPGYPGKGYKCETILSTDGFAETDFYLYITALESDFCDNALAYASYCTLDDMTRRPLSGSINFCPSNLDTSPSGLDSQVETAVHELIHTLVFSEALYDEFIYSNGSVIPQEAVLKIETKNSKTVAKIITPGVIQAARTHFACPTLDGIELENEGGDGTAMSHWESRIFQGEVMDGMGGIETLSNHHVMSPITLAFLQDSGWYITDHKVQSCYFPWGKDAGCSFAKDDCITYMSKNPQQDWFCDVDYYPSCTKNKRAYGMCMPDILMDGCSYVMSYAEFDCLNMYNQPKDGSKWGITYGANSFCMNEEHPITLNKAEGDSQKAMRVADCYKISCDDRSRMFLDIKGTKYECPANTLLDLSIATDSFATGGVYCGNNTICSNIGCPNDCSRHGYCQNNICYCYLSYTGNDCSIRFCNEYSDYCSCNIESGESYGTCTEHTNSTTNSAEIPKYHISNSVEVASDGVIDKENFKTALEKALPLIPASSITIVSIEPVAGSESSSTRKILISSVYKVSFDIETTDPAKVDSELQTIIEDGTLLYHLQQYNMNLIEGSMVTSEPVMVQSPSSSPSRSPASDNTSLFDEYRDVIVIVVPIVAGVIIIAVITIIICSVRRSNANNTNKIPDVYKPGNSKKTVNQSAPSKSGQKKGNLNNHGKQKSTVIDKYKVSGSKSMTDQYRGPVSKSMTTQYKGPVSKSLTNQNKAPVGKSAASNTSKNKK